LVLILAAKVHDIISEAELLHGFEEGLYGDPASRRLPKTSQKPELASKTTSFNVAIQLGKCQGLADIPEGRLQDLVESAKATSRPKVEHPFREVFQS
jgi:transposase, IS5 family